MNMNMDNDTDTDTDVQAFGKQGGSKTRPLKERSHAVAAELALQALACKYLAQDPDNPSAPRQVLLDCWDVHPSQSCMQQLRQNVAVLHALAQDPDDLSAPRHVLLGSCLTFWLTSAAARRRSTRRSRQPPAYFSCSVAVRCRRSPAAPTATL
jgi:hypothetical protein